MMEAYKKRRPEEPPWSAETTIVIVKQPRNTIYKSDRRYVSTYQYSFAQFQKVEPFDAVDATDAALKKTFIFPFIRGMTFN